MQYIYNNIDKLNDYPLFLTYIPDIEQYQKEFE